MEKYVKSCFIKNVIDNIPLSSGHCWKNLGWNPGVTWEIIQEHQDKPWCLESFSKNPNVDMEFIKTHPEIQWCWAYVSINPSITWEDIVENIDLPWDWSYLCKNPNITLEIIKENMEYPWNWYFLSYSKNVTLQTMIDNPQLPLDWRAFAYHNPLTSFRELKGNELVPCFIRDMIKDYNTDVPDIREIVLKSSRCTLQDVIGLEGTWNWFDVSKNSNISFDMIVENPQLPWDPYGTCLNPNISMQIIEERQERPWIWCMLCDNPSLFKLSPTKEMIKGVKRWHAACVIKRYWFKCMTDPSFKVCKKRLLNDFQMMFK
jgi:hypothetical protein